MTLDFTTRTEIHVPPEIASTKVKGVGRLMSEVEDIDAWLDKNLVFMDHPEIYASHGDEMNTVHRDWDTSPFKICLVGGMAYRNSVGNLAIPLLYSELIETAPKDWVVDRAHFWETRKNFKMTTRDGVPVVGLQSHRPLDQFDALLFSCSYLQTTLHIGMMLKWSGIAPRADERSNDDPYVVGGGHHMYVNSDPISHIPDIIWVGEFSAGGVEAIEDIAKARIEGRDKWEFIEERAKEGRRGFYVPSFYTQTYSKHEPYPIADYYSHVEGVPFPVKKAYSSNLDQEAHINKRPIVSLLNPGMGTAEIQSSFGCDTATCTFCSEGQTNKPFRFYSVDTIVEAAKEQMKYSGMRSFTLSAFDGAGHPLKRRLLRRLLEEVSDEVTLLSLRVDEMADDDIFSVVSTTAGNKTLSLGVEGMSERMRAVYQKWCNQGQILKVSEDAIASGATKLKYFMIANHPWETEEDRMEWVHTLKDIEALKEKYGSKCQILTSWTPLVIMPFTSLQWEAPTPDDRTLHGIIKAIKDETGTDFRIGSGGRRDEAYMAQLMQLGDRRLSHLIDWCIDNDFLHYGSTPKGMVETIEDILNEVPQADGTPYEAPLGFHTWFRPKAYSEPLPWDAWDVGVTKEWLIMVNEISKLGHQQVQTCVTSCSACGACSDLDRVKMAAGHAMPDDDFEIHEINVIKQRGSTQVLRLKLKIDRDHRFIGDEYWHAGLVRSARLADLPVDKGKIAMVSQRYKFFDYAYGIEYADVGMMERITLKQARTMAEFMPAGMELVDVRAFSPNVGLLRNVAGAVHYICDVRPVYSTRATKEALERMLGAEEFIATVKKKIYRKGMVSVDVDVRPWVLDGWVQPNGLLHLLLKGTANPYELLPAMYGVSRRKILPLDVVRAEIYLDEKDEGQVDAFRPVCPKTGVKVEANMYDEVHESGLAVKARYNRLNLDVTNVGQIQIQNISEQELAEDSELVKSSDLFDEMMAEELALVPQTLGTHPEPVTISGGD